MATFPGAVKTFTYKTDSVDYPVAADVNLAYDEITAIETALNTYLMDTDGSIMGHTVNGTLKVANYIELQDSTANYIGRPDDTACLYLMSAYNYSDGSYIILTGNASAQNGGLYLLAGNDAANGQIVLYTHGLLRASVAYNGDFSLLDDAEGAIPVFFSDASAKNIGIGTATPNANSILDLTSTTKAFLPPRMTGTQRDAISSPAEGMVVYNTSTHVLNFYNGSIWGAV